MLRKGVLAQIEADVVDDKMTLSSLLQKCIVLGEQAGSDNMRDWARQELHGYSASVPDYRRVPTGLAVRLTNLAGFQPITQRIDASVLPTQLRDYLSEEGIELEVAILNSGIGELEALTKQGQDEHRIMPPWAGALIDTLTTYSLGPNSRVDVVYWPLSDASLRGALVRIRTALAEIVAELISATPPSQTIPERADVDQAVNLVLGSDSTAIVVNHHTVNTTAGAVSSTYHGPVFHAGVEGTQLAWNNDSVDQDHGRFNQITAGYYRPLAEAMTKVRHQLPMMELSPEAKEDAEYATGQLLAEIVRNEPRPGVIRRSLMVIRGCLEEAATNGTSMAGASISDAARAAARYAIEQLAPF